MKKQIAILGSTGSIGTQALQVIEEHPDRYEAYVLTANNRVDDLIAQARKFKPEAVVIANETKYQQLKDALADLPIKVYAGEEALCQIVAETPIDIVLTAMVGYAGLKPTMNAIRARKVIALANKETLVVAGELIKRYSNPAGRLRALCCVPVFDRRGRQPYRKSYTDSFRRPVPHLHNGAACHRNQSTGPETPQLGYGSQNHHRLRFHDEQRFRGD
jgi:hypothetical protein